MLEYQQAWRAHNKRPVRRGRGGLKRLLKQEGKLAAEATSAGEPGEEENDVQTGTENEGVTAQLMNYAFGGNMMTMNMMSMDMMAMASQFSPLPSSLSSWQDPYASSSQSMVAADGFGWPSSQMPSWPMPEFPGFPAESGQEWMYSMQNQGPPKFDADKQQPGRRTRRGRGRTIRTQPPSLLEVNCEPVMEESAAGDVMLKGAGVADDGEETRKPDANDGDDEADLDQMVNQLEPSEQPPKPKRKVRRGRGGQKRLQRELEQLELEAKERETANLGEAGTMPAVTAFGHPREDPAVARV